MKSIQFPRIFDHHTIQTISDRDATLQNIKLTLSSEKGEFKFDPFFGIRLKRYLFEQNNYILKDILIDEIYEQLVLFVPQIEVNRKDIKLEAERAKIYLTIKCRNVLDFTLNTYNLVLFENQE